MKCIVCGNITGKYSGQQEDFPVHFQYNTCCNECMCQLKPVQNYSSNYNCLIDSLSDFQKIYLETLIKIDYKLFKHFLTTEGKNI
jgi:hypothetical protein